jgi:type I restriction enzyme S subunit
MAGDYPITKIGDLASSISETHKFGKEQLIFLNTSDIQHGNFLHRTYSTVKNWPGQAKKSIRKDDILFSEIRPANGRWAYVEDEADDFVVSTKLMVIRAKQDRLFPKFLYQFLTSSEITKWLQHLAESRSGTFPQITFDQVATLELPLPPLSEQRAIAHILGTLDDKIELNRRMNETLEAMARALFKSWFVDFDPVRAKAEGRDPGLPKPIADLFPDSFEDSALGEIPKGWQCSNVGKHFKLTMGQSPPGSTYNESGNGLPFFQGRTDFGFRFPSRRVFCTAPTRLAEVGDTLVSVRAPVGDVNIAIEPCAVGRGVAAVRHLSGSSSFTYHAMHNLGDHFGKFEGEGTVFGSINKADFERLPFVAPPQAVLDCFERLASPVDDRVESNEGESRILAALRDSLLPKLVSGELRVKHIAPAVA